MGVHQWSSNNKKVHLRSRGASVRRHLKKSLNKPRIVGEIPDIAIAPQSTLTSRRKNSRTNVTLSGKKKRKIHKTLKRLQKSKAAVSEAAKDVVMEEAPKKKGKKSKKDGEGGMDTE